MNKVSTYLSDYHFLRKIFSFKEKEITIPEQEIRLINIPFKSSSELIFPNDKQYYAPKLGGSSLNLNSILFEGEMEQIIGISDDEIIENKSFKYVLLKKEKAGKSKGAIVLFHGLNEKDWTKYLPWAKKLVELSDKSVILFPIAFHINRAFRIWHDARMMDNISHKRRALFSNIRESSFTNAAMSTRLHFAPARFFLSGLETYADIVQLTKEIKSGKHPFFEKNASIDFFGYSAGAFLAQILLMANRDGMFSDSKAVLFCGGALLSRMYLTSRYIMDSEAHQAILDFYVDNFERNLQNDLNLNHLFESAQSGGMYFKSMIGESNVLINQMRKCRFEELHKQIIAITLEKDTIMPPHEILASLINSKGNVAFPYKSFDFEFEYSHANPFPYLEKISEEVDESFHELFSYVAEFLA